MTETFPEIALLLAHTELSSIRTYGDGFGKTVFREFFRSGYNSKAATHWTPQPMELNALSPMES
jgi:hypothetical protein